MASTVGNGSTEGMATHRGAIDQTMITMLSPLVTVKRINDVLQSMGIRVQEESTYRFRCIRPRKEGIVLLARDAGEGEDDGNQGQGTPNLTLTFAEEMPSKDDEEQETTPAAAATCEPSYGPQTEEPGDEVRFSVELTKLDRLEGTYSLDLRRLRGNLRSYKYVYCEFRERIKLQ